MPSIVNGLFSGRSGIASHGAAIAVVGDNISNSSTIGFKASRAEFQDLIAGGQTSGKVIGTGSSISGVSTLFEQGTLEFTNRPLDLAIDGNGFFVVANGAQRYYTRAGNFKLNASGYIVDQNNYSVLGFPAGGSGALAPLNVNSVSQESVATTAVTITANLDAGGETIDVDDIPTVTAPGAGTPSTTTYADLNEVSEFSTVVEIFDSLGAAHTVTTFFFHTDSGEYVARAYVNSEDVDTSGSATGIPRLIGSATLEFGSDGSRTNSPSPGATDITATIPWNNGADATAEVDFTYDPATSFSAESNVLSISQDGKGIGSVTSISIEENGDIFALLSNGQSAIIGKLGLINFSNPEGLTRVGNNLLQQSASSGEPIVGSPQTGTLGTVQAGSIELSTVDIANEFVKIITLQRGFQANARIITSIDQLLNEIIQLA